VIAAYTLPTRYPRKEMVLSIAKMNKQGWMGQDVEKAETNKKAKKL